ncbi:MAG: dihydrodipicolinate synthase family protein [Rhodospirillales bacterium]|nr:dihydrodipicolinate synthase family protein [Rhodospirillales bacterium]
MKNPFAGTIPALMTPCTPDRKPDFDALVRKGKELTGLGMSGVVYCGSMGDWPLLTDEQRMEGVERLVAAGIPVIVGTGAQNTQRAAALAAHAKAQRAAGLMIIPRVLSRGSSVAAQRAHFDAVLTAGEGLPAVIYNSPYYGYETRADLFFDIRSRHANLVGFKEFGGASSLRYAAEHITGKDKALTLVVGVDTQVYHGFVNCGAKGAITGIGNVLPREVLHLVALCESAAAGNVEARRRAQELDEAMQALSSFDEGVDLVLYFKYLLTLRGESAYTLHFNETDALSPAQAQHAKAQLALFDTWYASWSHETGSSEIRGKAA